MHDLRILSITILLTLIDQLLFAAGAILRMICLRYPLPEIPEADEMTPRKCEIRQCNVSQLLGSFAEGPRLVVT